jgi:uncharacterized membrane protein YczE
MAKRIISLLTGTCFISFGIAIMSKASIGMSPISCFPYVMSLVYTRLTLGEWVLIWNALFALLQIPVMGRKYKLYLLTQVPLAFVLGYCTDFAKYLIKGFSVPNYMVSVLFVVLGTMFTALGVYLTVNARLIMNGPEAFIRAVSDRIHIKFGTLKSIFDISNMLLAAISSVIIFHKLEGVREGTVFAAVFTGIFVNIYTKIIDRIKRQKDTAVMEASESGNE